MTVVNNSAMENNEKMKFNELILKRAKKRHLTVSLDKMIYACKDTFAPFKGRVFKKALYVGVGHGHDALLAIKNDYVESAVGVDPYYVNHGNDDNDYEELAAVINELDMAERFQIRKTTIEDFIEGFLAEVDANGNKFDLVVFADVLHHIFVEKELLSSTPSFNDCVSLFSSVKKASTNDAVMIISEVKRHGLRPLLVNKGFLKGNVNYKTKQSEKQWIKAALKGGWKLKSIKTYIPFALKKWRLLFDNKAGRFTVSDRYTVYFTSDKTNSR